jgi:hypothetical protein
MMETSMVGDESLSKRLRSWIATCATALLLSSAYPVVGAPAAAQVASPVPPGAARIWFYRDYAPYSTRNVAQVALNGAVVGYSQPEGGSFYRDVAPGRYRIAVGTEQNEDVNQDALIDIGPGQQAFVKIVGTNTWDAGGDNQIYSRDVFYARLVPPQIAEAEIAR